MNRICVVAVALALAACANRLAEGPTTGGRVDPSLAPNAEIRLNTVAIVDKSLQRDREGYFGTRRVGKIAVEATDSRRTPTGTLEVWATLRNRTNFDLQIEGRTTFFDGRKVPIETPTTWRRVFLPANSIGSYSELSTGVEVAYYYIEVREAR
ncbi:MAG: hypothetical protein ACE5FL_09780 [Myxococcota bacterium]